MSQDRWGKQVYQGHAVLHESVSILVIGGAWLLYHSFICLQKMYRVFLIEAGAKAFIPNVDLLFF